METKPKAKHAAKKIALGAAGTVTGAGLALSGLFGTADELLSPDASETAAASGAAHVQVGEAPSAQLDAIPIPEQPTRADVARQWIWNLPAVVRALVLLPAWGLGRGVMTLLSLLWTALSPVWSALLSVLLHAGILLGLFALLYKLLFPNAKLADLFKKGRWLWILGCALLLAVADMFLARYVENYALIRTACCALLGALALLLLWNRLIARHAPPEAGKKWVQLPKAA